MKIVEFYKMINFGRVDFYPVDPTIRDAVLLITGKISPVMTKKMMQGFELLGLQFKEVIPPANGRKD